MKLYKKKEVNFYIKNYKSFSNATKLSSEFVCLKINRKSVQIKINDKIKMWVKIIDDFLSNERNAIVLDIFKRIVFLKQNEVRILTEINASRGTFQRIKAEIIDKIYHLAIFRNLISYDELLLDEINR